MSEMTSERLAEIADNNRLRRERKAATSPGPWHVINPDDAMCMNVFAVSTSEFNDGDMDDHYTKEEARQVVAITLLQTPRFVSPPEYLANTDFIAACKNDPVEDEVDSLLAEIDRLNAELAKARNAVEHQFDPPLLPEAQCDQLNSRRHLLINLKNSGHKLTDEEQVALDWAQAYSAYHQRVCHPSSAKHQAEDLIRVQESVIDQLKAELAEARKDTARLDWMADNTACFDEIAHGFEWEPEITPTIRDAIDAVADKEATWLS